MKNALRGRTRYPGQVDDYGEVWDVYYYTDAIPDSSTPTWTKDDSGGGLTISCSDGLLNLSITTTGYINTSYQREIGTMVTTGNKVLSFRGKITAKHGQWIRIADGVRQVNLHFEYAGTIYYENTQIASGLTLTDYFECRVEFNATTGMKLYVNDILIKTTAYTSLTATANNVILFGARSDAAGTGNGNVGAIYDWVFYKLND
jgi:hypothetical protein